MWKASKSILTLLSTLSLMVFGLTTPTIAATPKAGAVCSKAGLTATASGKLFTCIKSGKKLVWDKGVTIPKPVTTPVTPTPTPGTFLAKLYALIDFAALNIGKAKDKGE